ncbi:MAG: glycosyltransferase, partial [Deltaproteobacteria bacterium]|nr:glycosyltransferase [Deltaproteobacteria bacterium]
WPEAAKRWALMVEKCPQKPHGYFGGACALKEQGFFEAADALVLEGLKKFPKEPELYRQYGAIAVQRKDWPEAVKRWALMRKECPQKPHGYFGGARALKEQGSFEAADGLVLDGLKKFPKEPKLYKQYGDIAVRRKDWPEAAKRWALMVEKCPQKPHGYFGGACALKEQGFFDAADALVLEGLKKFPKEPELYKQYGDIAVRRKDWPEAVKRWGLMQENLPEHPGGYAGEKAALKEIWGKEADEAFAFDAPEKFPQEAGSSPEDNRSAMRQDGRMPETEPEKNSRGVKHTNIPKISVIIPLYNPGAGFDRCLESLRSQTFADMEMIFVDDCGTDGAIDKVRTLAMEDVRIRIVTNPENRGPGQSRNRGIEAARGKYLSFVDADDYVSPDFLELLYTKAHTERLDIVKGTCIRELDGLLPQKWRTNDVIRSGLAGGKPLYCLFTGEHWTGLYRRALLMESGARYGRARNSQDDVFLLRVCHAARTFGIEDRATYHYIFRELSTVNTFNAQRLENQLETFKEMVDYLVMHVGEDRNALGYASGKLGYLLKMHTHVAGIPELQSAAATFLTSLREQALRLPYLEGMMAQNFTIRAFVDYGVSLNATLFSGQWKELDNALTSVGLAKRWCDFAL